MSLLSSTSRCDPRHSPNAPDQECRRGRLWRRALAALVVAGMPTIFAFESAQAIVDGGTGEAKATFGSALRLGSAANYFCSAVLLSDTIALTAAHCVDNNRTRPIQIHMQRQGSRATPCLTWKSSNNTCAPRLMEVRVHPRWKAGKGTGYDIAVLYIKNNDKNNQFRLKNASIPKSHFARIYDDVWQKSRRQIFAGFGPSSPSGAGWGEYHESRMRVSDFYDKHFRNKAGPNSRICKGDSGGPTFLRHSPRHFPIVVGLNANIDVHSGQNTCAERGKWQRWVKVSPKVEWISQTVEDFTGKPCRPPFDNSFDRKFQLCFD